MPQGLAERDRIVDLPVLIINSVSKKASSSTAAHMRRRPRASPLPLFPISLEHL